jgi:hypothetical protein
LLPQSQSRLPLPLLLLVLLLLIFGPPFRRGKRDGLNPAGAAHRMCGVFGGHMGEPDKGKALLCPGERVSAGGVRPGLGSEASKCLPKIPGPIADPVGARRPGRA